MYYYRFEDHKDPFSGEPYRFILIFDSYGYETTRVQMGKPNDKRDNAWGVIRCAYLNSTPCECGAAKIGIARFRIGHSDWCPVYRSPLVTWDD